MQRVDNKIALVTGAARGIGLATARLLAQEGALVILTDILDDPGRQAARDLSPDTPYLHLDVACEDDWQAVAREVAGRFGGLDILVNNAGITGFLETAGPHDPEHPVPMRTGWPWVVNTPSA